MQYRRVNSRKWKQKGTGKGKQRKDHQQGRPPRRRRRRRRFPYVTVDKGTSPLSTGSKVRMLTIIKKQVELRPWFEGKRMQTTNTSVSWVLLWGKACSSEEKRTSPLLHHPPVLRSMSPQPVEGQTDGFLAYPIFRLQVSNCKILLR
jgi:hypothetical protein